MWLLVLIKKNLIHIYPASGKFLAIWLVEKNQILCCIILLTEYYFDILLLLRCFMLLTSPKCFRICWRNIHKPKAIQRDKFVIECFTGGIQKYIGSMKKVVLGKVKSSIHSLECICTNQPGELQSHQRLLVLITFVS